VIPAAIIFPVEIPVPAAKAEKENIG